MSKEYPNIEKGVFLNHAAISPIAPAVAQEAINALQALSTGAPDIDGWVLAMEKSRRTVAKLINCDHSSIGFMQNTSQVISTVSQGLQWNTEDEVLLPSYEYPANQYPWLSLEKQGVVINRAEPLNGEINEEWLLQNLTDKTKLVAFSHIQFSNGYRADVEKLVRLCKERGILTLVDAIQGFGAFPVDVTQWDVDFCAFGSQKWLMAPPGIAVLYVKSNRINEITPPLNGAFSVANPFDVQTIELTYPNEMRKIESGTMNFTLFPAFLKALELVEKKGIENITKSILERVDFLRSSLLERNYEITSPGNEINQSGIVTFTTNKKRIKDLYERLCKAHVTVTLRGNIIRFSPHFYNSEEELKEVVKLL